VSEDEALALMRAHLQTQFPKRCERCGRVYASLADYYRNTRSAGPPVSYDAEVGNWQPLRPAGTVSLADCACGTTLSLTSHGLALPKLWRLGAWALAEITRRHLPVREFLEELRAKIERRALDEEGPPGPTPVVPHEGI
jgi:hypothetical protein